MTRMNPYIAAGAVMQTFIDHAVAQSKASGIEASLQHLIKVRASQINGCAICLHMHTMEARKDGETEARLYLLDAWHEALIYSARERAALGWTEALTRLSETRAPDAAYDAVMAAFTPAEVVQLTLLINTINSFNRIGVGFRVPPLGLAPVTSQAALIMSLDAAAVFDPLRPRLVRIAYRMLGSVADAEDVVQEAYLRWHAADHMTITAPEAYLRRVVTRLCLDVLKSARRRREVYVGPWLPEPLVEVQAVDDLDNITLPLMLALDRLSPLERAAFLLHDVFGVAFEEVAEIIDRDPVACRQLASRARTHVRASRPRFETPKARGLEIAQAFFDASRSGDMTALQTLLAEDVALYSDGGGMRPAALRVVVGLADVIKVHGAIAAGFAKYGASQLVGQRMINGLPGFVTREVDGILQTTAFLIERGQIAAIYVMRNPDKLRHLEDGPAA